MNEIYLNHSILNGIDDSEVDSYVKEIINLSKVSEANGYLIRFSNRLWEISLKRRTLREYFFMSESRDLVTPFMMAALNKGPHFEEVETDTNLNIMPPTQSDSTLLRILSSCLCHSQNLLTSLSNESTLIEESYTLNNNIKNIELNNLIGEPSLNEFFLGSLLFSSAEEVFNKAEEARPNLVILDDAKKSAKAHNFHGRYKDIYNVLLALVDVELKHIKENQNDEVRKDYFFRSCKFHISGESTKTMQKRSCRRIREFAIPGKGKELFEWHAKVGLSTRIHYYIDIEHSKVYIGHCGEHLKT